LTNDRKEAPCLRPARGRWPLAGPQSVLKSPQFGVKSRHFGASRADKETTCLQARCGPHRSRTLCLPCRRSWVRIPSAALEKACICRSFSRPQSASAFASTGSHWVVAASPPREASESGSFAGRLWELEPVTFCAKPHHGVGVGVHLARDRVADDGAIPSGVASGRLPGTAFAHEQSRWEHRGGVSLLL
jgi:hypothetical protein